MQWVVFEEEMDVKLYNCLVQNSQFNMSSQPECPVLRETALLSAGNLCEGRRGLEDSDDSTGISTNSPQIIEKQQISFDQTGLGLDTDGIIW